MTHRIARQAVVTGGTGALGRELARALCVDGYNVWLLGRSADRTRHKTKRLMREVPGATVTPLVADFLRLEQVRRVAHLLRGRLSRLDLVIHAAGAVYGTRGCTAAGFERTLQTNHLAPFLLTDRLRDLVMSTPGGRVITVASEAHHLARLRLDDLDLARRYSAARAYSQSKLCNLLFTQALGRSFADTKATALAVDPGWFQSGLGAGEVPTAFRLSLALTRRFAKSAEAAASAVMSLARLRDPRPFQGRYFSAGRPATPSAKARDLRLSEQLWRESARRVGGAEPLPAVPAMPLESARLGKDAFNGLGPAQGLRA